ncbi:PREDICTED: KH domain-containing protein akap-1 [Atta colombica]|uniref:KH domain-containing protein akap-1 n=1 Tax=Atta colombica TaxID=520822 RepID=UPI00084BD3B0|nr:PREDICTED: KH domain-containing protein akap-1 [Atta colombica]XP_018046683.1 PREDICTED: KH domain-containing protein akap-1 [Atta colombica]XP_018046684.1 PREDICTED: KH domain-containing protein akap-1 [Atta colombica]XP_018046685.1 PREDICTED: KH domain-containing protein akap-1 [Atta colombica]XP_018046686.1 PREDICTED: KH domain-containing protein akap-1 [Atta colombica]XP_018046687.1 PREDICTED: KH domain-containing protein akap-1 [Atta colombica]XP_018046688.1 PREDICTED: KH domain-conta
MNSSIHVPLVKWTVPAVALVIALFWYKRRRIDRDELQWNDSGGTTKSNCVEKAISNNTQKIDTNIYDSGVQKEINQESSIDCCNMQEEEEEQTRISRKISKTMDIPLKNSALQFAFCNSSQNTYKDVGTICSTEVEFNSSNKSNTSLFETIATSASSKSNKNDDDEEPRIFQNVANEEQTMHCETRSLEQNYTEEYHYKKDEQESEGHTIKTQGREVDERDSANHSPISVVLDGSVTDEAGSEGSNTDSGKGGSINGCRKDNIASTTYDFSIPQHLVGRLIGRHGSFLHNIRTKANVGIYVNDHPCDGDHKICSIRGSVEGINVALKMVRQKFPEKRFPQVTLAEISTISEVNEEVTYNVFIQRPLSLVDGVNNDINICHIVKPNWLFVRLPTHPSFPLLQNLEDSMQYWYNTESISVPDVLNKGDYVAVYWMENWVRAYIEWPDPSGERSVVRLLDYGGYWSVSNSECRPLILNYLSLPFQAIEVFLANIQPKNGKWSSEAYNVVQNCSSKGVAQAQIEGRIQSNTYANIYFIIQNYGVISLTEELITNGFAERVIWEDMKPETLESICT